jgi:hypothetical protein
MLPGPLPGPPGTLLGPLPGPPGTLLGPLPGPPGTLLGPLPGTLLGPLPGTVTGTLPGPLNKRGRRIVCCGICVGISHDRATLRGDRWMSNVTTETERLPRAEALDLASRAMRSLAPYCERLEIAGSIRRHMKTIGDIELVAVPKMQRVHVGLFEDYVKLVSTLETAMTTYLATQGSSWALRVSEAGRTANGPKLKRLTYDGFGVDLFVVTRPAQWGVIFTIRTGPYLFSKQLVSHPNVRIDDPYGQPRWGVLPMDMKVEHGALWRGGQADPIETPEETDFFHAIGREYVDPWRRQ